VPAQTDPRERLEQCVPRMKDSREKTPEIPTCPPKGTSRSVNNPV